MTVVVLRTEMEETHSIFCVCVCARARARVRAWVVERGVSDSRVHFENRN